VATWGDLEAELGRWKEAGARATLWWRDDDAADATPALERLLALSADAGVAVHLAAIPACLSGRLPERLARAPTAWVLQHGYAHRDHAPKGAGSWELGCHRPLKTVHGELRAGMVRLQEAFANRFLPVIVPPWTRIAEEVVEGLAEDGYAALSLEGPRQARFASPGLMLLNAHCDPIKWKGGPRFTGVERALDSIVGHLRDRRSGTADRSEPTGLCTHHLAHDAEVWDFVAEFVGRTHAHPGALWTDLEQELSRAEAA
jgi:hypothetical protein